MKLAIAIPTYNESDNIQKIIPIIQDTLGRISDLKCTLFVVDDNSPDKTGEIAKNLGNKIKSSAFKIEVLHRKKKEGLGKAYVYAFEHILKQDFDFILQMDADLSHDPKYIPAFLQRAGSADFVVGSRYIRGGSTPDWSWNRKFLSRGGNLYTRFFLGSAITDYTGGFNLYATELLKKVDLQTLQAGGYGFLIELKYRALKNCRHVEQVPIVFMDRQHGVSKIPRSTILKNLILVPKLAKNS